MLWRNDYKWGINQYFSCGKASPVSPFSPDIHVLETGCLKEGRRLGSLRPTLRMRECDKESRLCVLVSLEERVWEGEQADG